MFTSKLHSSKEIKTPIMIKNILNLSIFLINPYKIISNIKKLLKTLKI